MSMEPLDFSNRQMENDAILDCMPHFLENSSQIPSTINEQQISTTHHQSTASPQNIVPTVVYPQMFNNSIVNIRPPDGTNATVNQINYSINSNNAFSTSTTSTPKSDDPQGPLSAQQMRLQRETPTERERRLTAGRERMRLYRQRERELETPDEKERRLAVARERTRLGRQLESPEQREKRLRRSRERLRMKRQQESPEERENRLKSHRDSKRERYRRMTPEERNMNRTPVTSKKYAVFNNGHKNQLLKIGSSSEAEFLTDSALSCGVKVEPQEEFTPTPLLDISKSEYSYAAPPSINHTNLIPHPDITTARNSFPEKAHPIYYINNDVSHVTTHSDINSSWPKNMTFCDNNVYTTVPAVGANELTTTTTSAAGGNYILQYSQNNGVSTNKSQQTLTECIQSNCVVYTTASNNVITSLPQT